MLALVLLRHGSGPPAAAGAETSPLALALQRGMHRVVAELIARGVDVRAPVGTEGSSLLHEVAARGWVDLIEAVLARAGDLDGRDALGRTPLMAAAAGGLPEAVELLLARGADTKLIDRNGDDAGKHACASKRKRTLALLGASADTCHPAQAPLVRTAW